jgi:hypothetical protein
VLGEDANFVSSIIFPSGACALQLCYYLLLVVVVVVIYVRIGGLVPGNGAGTGENPHDVLFQKDQEPRDRQHPRLEVIAQHQEDDQRRETLYFRLPLETVPERIILTGLISPDLRLNYWKILPNS